MSLEEALEYAAGHSLDLVQVSEEQGKLPTCLVQDYNKTVFDMKKKQNKNKPNNTVIKEIRLSPSIAAHDMKVKAKKIMELLQKNNHVKIGVIFKGRERTRIMYRGKECIDDCLKYIGDNYDISKPFRITENKAEITLSPKK